MKSVVYDVPLNGMFDASAAASTPGIARALASSARMNASIFAAESNRVLSSTAVACTPCGSNPGSTLLTASKLRTSNPAPTLMISASATSLTTSAFPHRLTRAPCPECRRRAEDQGAAQRDRDDIREHRSVDAEVVHAKHVRRLQPNEKPRPCPAGGKTARAAHHREHQTLGERLTYEPAAPRAESEPQRNLALAACRLYEQQIAHVRAGDQQQKRNRREQHEQRQARVADEIVVQRHHQRAHVLVRFGILRLEPRDDRLQLRVRVRFRRARLEARDGAHVMGASESHVAGFGLVPLDRLPGVDALLRVFEARRHHANDLYALSADRHRLADDRGIRPEVLAPALVAEYDQMTA